MTFALSLNTVFAQESIGNDNDFSPLENCYLGQKPLGLIPELFALDLGELYFSATKEGEVLDKFFLL
ncbi:hypothetical protein [Kordia sp.]|uniref:hypothetical protein n=1 Tax=Kordia sp. TaxID=1965332 RepID=UPI003D2B075B